MRYSKLVNEHPLDEPDLSVSMEGCLHVARQLTELRACFLDPEQGAGCCGFADKAEGRKPGSVNSILAALDPA